MATEKTILLLDGDGIGPEVAPVAVDALRAAIASAGVELRIDRALIGGRAIDETGSPLPEETLSKAHAADAILLGAVGGPRWEGLPMNQRPEKGLLGLRYGLELFANLRPALLFGPLAEASSLKSERVAGLDILIVRELTGGIYFGEPRGVRVEDNERVGVNTYVYREHEIERIARVAFELAARRQGRLCSVDKANVLEVTQLWRDVVSEVAPDYPEVELSHMYVDNAGMQLVREPKQFDVIVTGNMFGDILSDVAAMLTGSLGMLPSASLAASGKGLYEPVHGSAPDIAGQDRANPLAMALSAAMLCRYSPRCARCGGGNRDGGWPGSEQGVANRRHRCGGDRRGGRRASGYPRHGRCAAGGIEQRIGGVEMSVRPVNVAIAGATGAVGEALLEILEERDFPVERLFSAGQRTFRGEALLVPWPVADGRTPGRVRLRAGADRALFGGRRGLCAVCAQSRRGRLRGNRQHLAISLRRRCALDRAGGHRHRLPEYGCRNIIANPNCSTIQMVVALKPIFDAVGIERINVATYQAVSGAGAGGVRELAAQTANLLNAKPIESTVAPVQIAFNAIPHIDSFQKNGYTKEEMKMVWETRKILEDDRIGVNPTCVRIPVFYGHSEAVHIETRLPIAVAEVRALLAEAPGVVLRDHAASGGYPTAALDGVSSDAVFVGRIRQDCSHPRGLNLWVVSDNVRKGAALNSVQIAEELLPLLD